MATQVSLNSGAVASAGALALQTNGTTQAVSISTGQVATFAQNPVLTSGTINGVAYLNGSNVLTTGSALVFDGTNLGVGTSSPAKRLDVRQAYTADTVVAQIGNTNNGNGATPVATIFDFTEANGTPVSRISSIYTQSTGKTDLAFGTYNSGLSEKMRLDSSGNLGLGVTPSAWGNGRVALDVKSNGAVYSGTNMVGLSGNAYDDGAWKRKAAAGATLYEASSQHAWYVTGSSTAGSAISWTQAMTLDASLNLGVGTTSPTARLHVAGAAGEAIIQDSDTAKGSNPAALLSLWGSDARAGYVGYPADSNMYINQINNNAMLFLTNNTERARIDSSGNFLITGSATNYGPSKFCVASNGSQRIAQLINTSGTDASAFGLYIGKYSNDSTTSQRFIGFSINNDSNGSGQINANGASQAAFGSFSDERLKENIVDLEPQLEKVMALRPVEFDYKDGSGHQTGFVAQEMQQVYPDAVGEQDGYLTITGYGKTEARLIKAIQEQQSIIQQLTDRITILEGK